LVKKISEWKGDVERDRLPPLPKRRPTDLIVLNLAWDVIAALDKAKVPLKVSRVSRKKIQLIEVLQLMRGWADEIDERAPRKYDHVYAFAKKALERYHTGRRFTEVEPLVVLR
jgi:hypothetical protein